MLDPEIKRSKVKVIRLLNALPAWACMSMGLLRFLLVAVRADDGRQQAAKAGILQLLVHV